jgi:segregation and condensation protein B
MTKEINLFENEIEVANATEDHRQTPPPMSEVLPKSQDPQAIPEVRLKARRIIESLLFASHDPVSFDKIREVVDAYYAFRPKVLRELIDELQHEYITEQRAFRLEEIAQGFALRTCEEYSPYIQLMVRNKRTEKLSQAAVEVLAIIAYKQPITRPQIEAIRGVDSSGTVQNLLERQLIEPVGKLEAPGRPTLYGITKDFLQYFGLRDLKDLPRQMLRPAESKAS